MGCCALGCGGCASQLTCRQPAPSVGERKRLLRTWLSTVRTSSPPPAPQTYMRCWVSLPLKKWLRRSLRLKWWKQPKGTWSTGGCTVLCATHSVGIPYGVPHYKELFLPVSCVVCVCFLLCRVEYMATCKRWSDYRHRQAWAMPPATSLYTAA